MSIDGIDIIGRDDCTNGSRKSLDSLIRNIQVSHFTILLDHQPFHLEETEAQNVDFQFSGHTHYGQVWPISWIEDAIYELAYGKMKKGIP